MLCGRKLKSFDPEQVETAGYVNCHWNKITNTINKILCESNKITLPN